MNPSDLNTVAVSAKVSAAQLAGRSVNHIKEARSGEG